MFSFKKVSKDYEPNTVYAPVDGEACPIEKMDDEVFADKMLGDGMYILPTCEKIFSPVSGVVANIADTFHAYNIITTDGLELMLHIGIDTVSLGGKVFNPKVKINQKISVGDLICIANFEEIKAAKCSTETAIVITNSDKFILIDKMYGKCMSGETKLFSYIMKP